MNILRFLSEDEYKQQQWSKFIVEAALLQLILCVIATVLYFTIAVDPFIFIVLPPLGFVLYCTLRYLLAGIEFSHVFTTNEYKKTKRHLLIRAASIFVLNSIAFSVVSQSLFDGIAVALISAVLFYSMERTSLKKSYNKNKRLLEDE